MMKKIKNIYVCTGTFHLFTSVYLASKMSEDAKEERILIYRDIVNRGIPIQIFNRYFDKTIYVKNHEFQCLPVRLIKRIFKAGWLFPFTREGRVCYTRASKYRIYVFDDYDLLSNSVINATKKRKESIILVDEGMMLYSTNQYWLSIKRRKWLDAIMGIKIKGCVEHNHAIDTILCRYPEKLPDVKIAGRIVKKLPNIFDDTQWVSEMLALLHVEIPVYTGKLALWLGEPLKEIGMEEIDELEFIRQLARALGDKYSMIVKAHPRDRQGKYDALKSEANIKVLNVLPWIPVELIMSKLKPDIVLSAISSATDSVLKTNKKAKAIYCAKAMRVNLNLNKELISMLRGKNKYYPDTVEEIKKILQDE